MAQECFALEVLGLVEQDSEDVLWFAVGSSPATSYYFGDLLGSDVVADIPQVGEPLST
jgi:hypothetical protein